MLILTRGIGKMIYCLNPNGTIITINVLGVKGNQVRIGIDAPKDIIIHRSEVLEKISHDINPNLLLNENFLQ